jgi:hypothetical protein
VHLRAFGFKTRKSGHVVCARVDVRLHKIQVHVKGVADCKPPRGEPKLPGGCHKEVGGSGLWKRKRRMSSKRFNVNLGCDLVARFNQIEGRGA